MKQTPQRFRLLYFIILLAVPLLFFVLLEFTLRLAGYGIDTSQWVHVTDDKVMLNPNIGRRYFQTIQTVPVSNQDVFDVQKRPDAFRVFVLGESSGAGYPYLPVGAFSRWLRQRLQILYPDCTIEVVNLSLTAVNSYTLRDLVPGVLEQQPDLILIYSGHNEYYGALGVGSMESLGSNVALVRLTLFLNSFKTTELLRNVIQTVSRWISNPSQGQDGTLMSRMARDQYIELDSDDFLQGLVQYEHNIRDVLEMAREKNVPVILGTLTNNLKDQKPFISLQTDRHPPADRLFQLAHEELKRRNLPKADSLFRLAKDLDVLRFRSSEKMNELINRLGNEYRIPVVPVDSAFNANSPDGIVGENLMTDHLHPTLQGYAVMARLYFDAMKANGYLPRCEARQMTDRELDDAVRATFPFSRLDSVIAHYRITALKNDWPYVERHERKPMAGLITPRDFVERAALRVILDEEPWESVQRGVASWYLQNKDYENFRRQMDVLIGQYPIIVEYYDLVATEMLKVEQYDVAYAYLERRRKVKPDAYPAKWLGIIDLSRGRTASAISFLEESLNYNSRDPQVLYNLSGAYSYAKEYQKALTALDACLAIDPDYPKAAGLRKQLERLLSSK